MSSSKISIVPIINKDGSVLQTTTCDGKAGYLYRNVETNEVMILPLNSEMGNLFEEEDVCPQDTTPTSPTVTPVKEIWRPNTGNRPVQLDKEATAYFIKQLKSDRIQKLIHDKQTRKALIWKILAEDMQGSGYSFGERAAQEVVAQKYMNLKKTYENFVKKSMKTGQGKVEEPEHYEDLFYLFGNEHEIHPPKIVDSLANSTRDIPTPSRKRQCVDSETPSSSKFVDDKEEHSPPNDTHFNKAVDSTKPKRNKITSTDLFNLLKEDSKIRQLHHEEMKSLIQQSINQLEKQNQQRDTMLGLLAKLVEK